MTLLGKNDERIIRKQVYLKNLSFVMFFDSLIIFIHFAIKKEKKKKLKASIRNQKVIFNSLLFD